MRNRGPARTCATELWWWISSTSPASSSAPRTAVTCSTAWPAPSWNSRTISSTPPTTSWPTPKRRKTTSTSGNATPTRSNRMWCSMRAKRHRFKNRRGSTHPPKASRWPSAATAPQASTKPSRQQSKRSAISSATWCSSDHSAAPLIPCWPRSTRTPSWRGKPTSPTNAPTTPAGTACSPTSKKAQARHTPSQASWCSGQACGPPKPSSPGKCPYRTASPTSSGTTASGTSGSTTASAWSSKPTTKSTWTAAGASTWPGDQTAHPNGR